MQVGLPAGRLTAAAYGATHASEKALRPGSAETSRDRGIKSFGCRLVRSMKLLRPRTLVGLAPVHINFRRSDTTTVDASHLQRLRYALKMAVTSTAGGAEFRHCTRGARLQPALYHGHLLSYAPHRPCSASSGRIFLLFLGLGLGPRAQMSCRCRCVGITMARPGHLRVIP